MTYGTVTDHGTMFVGFSAEQRPLATMLESMVGLGSNGKRDALTYFTRPLTGSYYFVPSTETLAESRPPTHKRYSSATSALTSEFRSRSRRCRVASVHSAGF